LRFAVDRTIVQDPRLATTQFLLVAERFIHRNADKYGAAAIGPSRTVSFSAGGISFVPASPSDYFVEVGHSIFTVLLAVVGGWVGKRMYVTPGADMEQNPEAAT